MVSAFDRIYKLGLLLSIVDWLMFNVVFLVSHYFNMPFLEWNGDFLTCFIVANISYVIALQSISISLHHRLSQPARVLSNTSRTSVLFVVFYAAFIGMFTHVKVPNAISMAVLAFLIFLATSIERLCLRSLIKNRRSKGRDSVNTVILGADDMLQRAANVMANVWTGYNLLGYFSDNASEPLVNVNTGTNINRIGGKGDVMDFLEKNHVDELYIGDVGLSPECFRALMRLCDKNMIRMYYVPSTVYGEFRTAKVKEFGDIYVISQYNEPLRDVRNRIKKRAFDIFVSLLFICTLFPIILVVVFVISKITMPGPLFFKQKRTGYDGRDFWCYKFRSMKVNKDANKLQAVKNDPRITKWGAFMRHTNIDELPQFINVLKGDMSLVGPRPHMLAHTDYYSELISDYMIRHYVKPGITGWAQTHGERGETKTVEDMRRRVKRDIWYIEHWSFWLDIQIMFKTLADAIHGDEKAF